MSIRSSFLLLHIKAFDRYTNSSLSTRGAFLFLLFFFSQLRRLSVLASNFVHLLFAPPILHLHPLLIQSSQIHCLVPLPNSLRRLIEAILGFDLSRVIEIHNFIPHHSRHFWSKTRPVFGRGGTTCSLVRESKRKVNCEKRNSSLDTCRCLFI